MSDNPKRRDFDWVGVRHQCTAHQAFPRLRKLAERDVEARETQINADPYLSSPPRFESSDEVTPTFSIRRGRGPNPDDDPEIRFRLVDSLTIRVDGSALADGAFDVRVGMDDQGECLLTIDGRPVLDWQILHRALDELLFGAVRSGGSA